MSPTSKLDIATELLDRALKLFYERDSYFAALHLAGAAEEVLGAYVRSQGGVSAYESLRDGAVKLSKHIRDDGIESAPKRIANAMNHAKNATKHMDDGDDDRVYFNVEFEARERLDLAVTNYYMLMQYLPLRETPLLQRFNSELISR